MLFVVFIYLLVNPSVQDVEADYTGRILGKDNSTPIKSVQINTINTLDKVETQTDSAGFFIIEYKEFEKINKHQPVSLIFSKTNYNSRYAR